ncbi:MAG TPA: rod shape-determining protein MreC [Flavobacteriaceae bacterium]|nr:rod shape-determining protein MreC [Flavobacteriaceae bacterium]
MQQIFNFLIRHKNTIFFLLLLSVSLFLTVQSHSYHKSKFVSSTNFLTGGLYDWMNDMGSYLHLREYNDRLVEENEYLRSLLFNENIEDSVIVKTDSTSFSGPFSVVSAKVISNNYSKTDNYLLLDRGKNEGIKADLGVITNNGIVGIVEETTKNFSRVLSILNSNSAINVRLKKSNHYGTLVWNGKNPNLVQLTYVPKIANVQKGDTVITGGKSFVFPEGIPVGIVHDFQLGKNESYYDIDIQLFNDMTNIGHVYVIENKNKQEFSKLNSSDDE